MKKLLTVTFWSAILTLARVASGLLIAKAVAVYTGPAGMAMLGQVQSLVSVLAGITASPGGNGLVRYTAQCRDKGFDECAPWWSSSLKWGLSLLLPVVFLAALACRPISEVLFLSGDYAWLVLVVTLVLPFSMANTFMASVLNGQENYRRYVVLGLVSVIASTVAMLALIGLAGLNGALTAVVLSSAISGAIMLFGVSRQPWFRLRYWWGLADKVHVEGVRGYVAMAVTTAVTGPLSLMVVRKILVDQVGWIEAGHWQAVYRISEVYLSVVTIALGTYFLPRLSSLSGYETIRREINRTALTIMPFVIVLSFVVYLLRDVAISTLLTEEFHSARDLFSLQLVGDVIKIFSWLYAFSMVSSGATKWYIFSEIAFSASLILLTWLLVGLLGVQGAVMAYMVNYSFYCLFVIAGLRRFVC